MFNGLTGNFSLNGPQGNNPLQGANQQAGQLGHTAEAAAVFGSHGVNEIATFQTGFPVAQAAQHVNARAIVNNISQLSAKDALSNLSPNTAAGLNALVALFATPEAVEF